MRWDTEVPASVPPTQHAHKYSIIPLHQCTTFPYVPRQIYIRLFVRIHATYIHLYVCMYIHITIYKNTYLNKQIHFSKDHLSLKEGCDQERKQRPPTSRHSPEAAILVAANMLFHKCPAEGPLQKSHLPSKPAPKLEALQDLIKGPSP